MGVSLDAGQRVSRRCGPSCPPRPRHHGRLCLGFEVSIWSVWNREASTRGRGRDWDGAGSPYKKRGVEFLMAFLRSFCGVVLLLASSPSRTHGPAATRRSSSSSSRTWEYRGRGWRLDRGAGGRWRCGSSCVGGPGKRAHARGEDDGAPHMSLSACQGPAARRALCGSGGGDLCCGRALVASRVDGGPAGAAAAAGPVVGPR